jgi:cytochrome P450
VQEFKAMSILTSPPHSEVAQTITLANPAIFDDPYPIYERLVAESPVYRDPVLGLFVVTGFAAMQEIMADHKRFSSVPEGHVMAIYSDHPDVLALYDTANAYPPLNTLVTSDPPSHLRYRTLVDKAIGATNSRKLGAFIESCVNNLIDDFGDADSIDFVEAFAMRLPLMVIGHLLGVPADFSETARAMAASTTALADGTTITHEELLANHRIQIVGQKEFDLYIDRNAHEDGDDLLAHLSRVTLDSGEHLSRREIHSVVQALLVGGNDTTPAALSNAMLLLARDPALQSRLRENPDLIGAFVEEALRIESPVQGMYRRATVESEIAGTVIPEGSPIVLRFGAANRDPARFGCPVDIDLSRKGLKTHMAFGYGIHYCVGNILARLEMRIATEQLLHRLDSIIIDPDAAPICYEPKLVVRNPRALWLKYSRRRAMG